MTDNNSRNSDDAVTDGGVGLASGAAQKHRQTDYLGRK